jgi:hypothetical protein
MDVCVVPRITLAEPTLPPAAPDLTMVGVGVMPMVDCTPLR